MRTNLGQEEEPEVQMAPMIDCMFLLLIFFLVTASIRKKHMDLPIDFYNGEKVEQKKDPDDTLIVSLVKSSDPKQPLNVEFALSTVGEQMKSSGGQREMKTLDQLRRELAVKAQQKPNRRVRIDSDVKIPFQRIAQVLDFCKVYGLTDIGLRTRDKPRE